MPGKEDRCVAKLKAKGNGAEPTRSLQGWPQEDESQ